MSRCKKIVEDKNRTMQKYNGGKRKTQKRKPHKKRGTRRAPSEWNKQVMKVWGEMKHKGHSFKDALKEAARRRKKGTA